jgi:hypothetical protein
MAGEQKGKAYEALTKFALEDLKAAGAVRGRIFWDEKPEAMTIVPDLTVGRSINAPEIVFLINHSGAAGNSHMKAWRNMGELAEAKILLAAMPRVFVVTFDSVIKEDLKKVQAASFDGQIIVGDRPYGRELQKWVDQHVGDFPRDKDEKVEYLRDARKTYAHLARLSKLFRQDLEALVSKRAPKELDKIWAMDRTRTPGLAPKAKKTSVRRGLSKLLIFEDLDVALRLYTGKRVKLTEVPVYAYELELAGKALGHATPGDEEIHDAVKLLGESTVRRILKKAPVDLMARWLVPLRVLGEMAYFHDYVLANLVSLKDPAKLFAALVAVATDPSSILTTKVTTPINWLYYYLTDFIKAASKKSQAFGYAQLVQKVRAELAEINAFLKKLKIAPIEMRGQSALERGLRDWLNRLDSEQARNFSRGYQAATAFIVAKELGLLDPKKLPTAAAVKAQAIASYLEQKLVTYRDFQPLRDLVTDAVKDARLTKLKSGFAQRAQASQLTGDTGVLLARKTLIAWQSCSDAGRDHKKKELCGRAIALRYSWNDQSKKFIKRPGVEKLILVLDGTWRQSDLDALARAGWDEIFYPDEMEKLAKAIA